MSKVLCLILLTSLPLPQTIEARTCAIQEAESHLLALVQEGKRQGLAAGIF
jgi:hypothetical protein